MITKLNEAVSIIDTEALGHRNVVAAYLVVGKETALIDMGYQSSAETVARELTDHGIDQDSLDYLLPTHVHLDHAGSCGTLARKFTKASILVHPKGEQHLADPTRLWNGARELFGEDLMMRYGKPEPIERKRLRSAADNEVVDLGGAVRLRATWTPGHASHHLSYEWEGRGAVFTGDAVGIRYPDLPTLLPTTPPTSFNLEQALESLRRLQAGSPSKFYTPHYGEVDDATSYVTRNVESLQQWTTAVDRMSKNGLSSDDISLALTEEMCAQTGRSIEDVPDYLRMSVRISILGLLLYLERRGTVQT